jgi:lipoprotein Spr
MLIDLFHCDEGCQGCGSEDIKTGTDRNGRNDKEAKLNNKPRTCNVYIHLFLSILFTFIILHPLPLLPHPQKLTVMYRLFIFLVPCFGVFVLACGSSKKTVQPAGGDIIVSTGEAAPHKAAATPKYDSIQIKYAGYLHTTPELVQNIRLYRFIDRWMFTPYKWGGTDEKGIDCSAFLQRLLSEVYRIEIPRTSIQQFFDQWIERYGSAQYLSEGDLVFFQTIGDNAVSHVGFYLGNHMFVNSSSSKGVSIASLDDPYWKKRFVAAGRIKRSPPVQ